LDCNQLRRENLIKIKQISFRFSETLSSSSEGLSGVPQRSVLDSLLLNLLINDLCDAINCSRYLLFADDDKTYRAINSPEDYNLIKSRTDFLKGWCTANCTKLSICKTKVISFSKNTNILMDEYEICQSLVIRTDSANDRGVFLCSKLHFRDHIK
jgi:hypothetical protein